MKGDFSRITFDPTKHYRSVLMQQGRIQLDADWNEQAAIIEHHLTTQAADLIGESGTPFHNPGFKICANNVLRFDGVDDLLQIQPSVALARLGHFDFSIELALIPQTVHGGTLLFGLHTDGLRYVLSLGASGFISFTFSLSGEQWSIQSKEPLLPEHHYFVALTREKNQVRLYINGKLSAEVTIPHHRAQRLSEYYGALEHEFEEEILQKDNNVIMLVGASKEEGHYRNFFHGDLNFLRLWLRALAPWQIKQNIAKPITKQSPGLAADYRFSEGSGAETQNHASKHHPAVLGQGVSSPSWVCRSLWISSGRYYVGGVLCENEQDTPLYEQPQCPRLWPRSVSQGLYLAYLDVWIRTLSAIEDSSLLEVALGGPDTTVRNQTVWQVKLLPVYNQKEQPEEGREWKTFTQLTHDKGRLTAQRAYGSGGLLENTLYRVEVHHSGTAIGAAGPSSVIDKLIISEKKVHLKDPFSAQDWPPGQWVEILKDPYETQTNTRVRILKTNEEQQTITLEFLPGNIVQGEKLFLKRIASFKWSRDNGIKTFAINERKDSVFTLKNNPLTNELKKGDWLELIDDESSFGLAPGALLMVQNTDGNRVEVWDKFESNGLKKKSLLRRWDHNTKSQTTGALPISPNEWIELEKGILVRFESQGFYHSGDYWLIPTRTAEGDIHWPKDEQGPVPQAPQGVYHGLTPLALLKVEGVGVSVVDDYRKVFSTQPNHTPTQPQPQPKPLPPRYEPKPMLPEGVMLLSETLQEIPGFTASKLQLEVTPNVIEWNVVATTDSPQTGSAAVCSVLDKEIFAFFESGDIFKYSPSRKRWSFLKKVSARTGFGVASFERKFHIIGGRETNNALSVRHEVYDPATNEVKPLRDLPRGKEFAAVVGLPDGVHVIGGKGHRLFLGEVPTRSHYRYQSGDNSWVRLASMPTPGEKMGVSFVRNNIYIIGGSTQSIFENEHPVDLIYSYNIINDTWSIKARLSNPKYGISATTFRDEIYISGGRSSVSELADFEKYSPATEDVIILNQLHSPKSFHSLNSIDNSLFIFDGLQLKLEQSELLKKLYVLQKIKVG